MTCRVLLLAAALSSAWPSAFASITITPEDRAAIAECLARWKDVEGTWVGTLQTPGAEKGSPYLRTIDVKLVFGREHTTLLIRAGGKSWQTVGDDPRPAREKTRLLIEVPSVRKGDPKGHSLSFSRLSETAAQVIYARGPIHPKAGQEVRMTDMVAGVMVREGSPVPTGIAAMRWECVPPRK